MTNHIRHLAASLTLTLGGWSAAGCADSPTETNTGAIASAELASASHDDRSVLFPPDAHPYGRSLEEWAETWWRWGLGIPLAENPNDTATASADIHQGGRVYFLPNPPPGGSTSFTVQPHTAIAVLLSSIINDYPCPDPSFQPGPGQSLFDFLLQGAVDADNVAHIEGTLDGVALDHLDDYHFTSHELMTFTGDPSLAVLDPCITGSPQPAAIEAHFVLIKPLDPGTHVLSTHLTTTAGTVRNRTSTITVPDR